MTYTISHNNGRIVLAKPSYRSSKSVISEDSSYISDSLDDQDGATGTEIMPHTKFIFVQHCFLDLQFFQGATKTYELLDDKGLRIFFGKEIPGSSSTAKKSTFVKRAEVSIHILDLKGEDVLKMEGHRRGCGRTRAKFEVHLRGHKFLGEIMDRKKSCCWTRVPSVEIIGRNEKMLIRLSEESKAAMGNFCKHRCSFSTISDDNLTFDIFLGGKLGTRIGGLGLIGSFFPEIPPQLNNCVGVELHSDLSVVDKLLLMASIFVRNIPSNPQPEHNTFPNLEEAVSSVEYRIEMNSGDDSYIVREVKTETESETAADSSLVNGREAKSSSST